MTVKRFTSKQGEYLAFIREYISVHGRAPSEADLRERFRVTAPSVHQMVLTLERRGLIARTPGMARSIRLLAPPAHIPRPGEDVTAGPVEDIRKELVSQLVGLLRKGRAHAPFDAAVAGLPPALRGVRPSGAAHSAWQLVEHLRLAQRDILDFCRRPDYVEGTFPQDYWPASETPPDARAWRRSVRGFQDDLREVIGLLEDPALGPFARVAAGGDATLLQEALILADHNAYHVGQLVSLRRSLGAWHA